MIKWSNISWKKKTKIHVKTHKIIVFKAFSLGFLLILLCNQRSVATGLNWLLTNRSISVAVRSSCGLFPVHRTGPANTNYMASAKELELEVATEWRQWDYDESPEQKCSA